MFRRHTFAWSALLAVVVLAGLMLGPGHRGATAQATAARSPWDHPNLIDTALRRTRTTHTRALLALALAKVPAHSRWLASWAAAPEAPSSVNLWSVHGLNNVTVREITMMSSAGAAVRVHLSNLDGTRPLVIGRASMAIASSFGRLASRPEGLTFGGESYVTIPAGDSVVSDPVVLGVHPLQRLAISVYLPEPTGPLTYHGTSEQSAFLGVGDDVARVDSGWTVATSYAWYLLTGVDTLSPPRYSGTVAALGDSITAGYRSTPGSFGAWPDDLARRLSRVRGSTLAVIDEGISGNRLLNPSPCCGPSALSRFGSDVVDQAGARDVILLEGTNDLGYSQDHGALTEPHTDVSAAQVIAADKRIIAAAHTAGLRIFGATLLPFRGAHYWTPAAERKREAINEWILTSGAFDGVINFAALMAQPGHPWVLDPADDSGDHLHPNNRGYTRMADAIRLAMLTGPSAATTTTRRPARAAKPARI